jgi:hypothetical protein
MTIEKLRSRLISMQEKRMEFMDQREEMRNKDAYDSDDEDEEILVGQM